MQDVIEGDGGENLVLFGNEGADGYGKHNENQLIGKSDDCVHKEKPEGLKHIRLGEPRPEFGKLLPQNVDTLPKIFKIRHDAQPHQNQANDTDGGHGNQVDGAGEEAGKQHLMGGDGEGEGQIAFIGEAAAVEADDLHDQRRHTADDEEQHGRGNGQRTQNLQPLLRSAGTHQIPDGDAAQQPGAHQTQAQNAQYVPSGTEFHFQQFGKHLNTSRNSSSSDLPVSSRTASTFPPCKMRPWDRNRYSSSTRSTSAIRWVEISTVALGS